MIEITKDQGLSGKMFSKITESVPDNDREVILDYYHKNILFEMDALNNPHNEKYGSYAKWPRRDRAEVIADYKLGIARAMMDRLHKIHGV